MVNHSSNFAAKDIGKANNKYGYLLVLIIPIHDNFDWKKPPVITLCLVFACCVIYLCFQAKDEAYIQKSYQYYLQSKLPTIEFPRYIDFLHELGEHRKAKTITKLSKHRRFRIAILQTTLRDSQFQTALNKHKIIQRNESVFQQWQPTREHFLELLNKSVTLRYGLIPAKPGIINHLSYNFLHGSFSHLLGNMIFLLVLGFALERTLSRTVFLSMYLATGVLSGAFYVFMDPLSTTPTIGASGAISGLMGLYTLIYGLRRVNFFFYAIVYFDYIKAPAIILFPIWLGHELYQLHSNPNTNINYFAHIGGLLSGALAGIMIKLSKLKIDFSDNHAAHDKERLDKKLNDALKAFGALNYEKARQSLKILHKDYPDNILVLEHYYSVLNHGLPGDTYHREIGRASCRERV